LPDYVAKPNIRSQVLVLNVVLILYFPFDYTLEKIKIHLFSVEKIHIFFLSAKIQRNTDKILEKYATHSTEPDRAMTFLSKYNFLTFRFLPRIHKP